MSLQTDEKDSEWFIYILFEMSCEVMFLLKKCKIFRSQTISCLVVNAEDLHHTGQNISNLLYAHKNTSIT